MSCLTHCSGQFSRSFVILCDTLNCSPPGFVQEFSRQEYNTKNHDHKMEKLGLGLDDESNNQQAAATQSPGDSRRLSIQRCIQSLVHACQCRNANCSLLQLQALLLPQGGIYKPQLRHMCKGWAGQVSQSLPIQARGFRKWASVCRPSFQEQVWVLWVRMDTGPQLWLVF